MDTIIQPVIRKSKRSGYRHHPVEFKRAVVQQSMLPGTSVSRVAREHNINANQVFAWRKLFNEGLLGNPSSDRINFLPVKISEPSKAAYPIPTMDSSNPPVGAIELEIGKARLRIEGHVDGAALTQVLELLFQ
jgi:transposase